MNTKKTEEDVEINKVIMRAKEKMDGALRAIKVITENAVIDNKFGDMEFNLRITFQEGRCVRTLDHIYFEESNK
jgi:hypothetical protein